MSAHAVTATVYPAIGEAIVTGRVAAKRCDDVADPFSGSLSDPTGLSPGGSDITLSPGAELLDGNPSPVGAAFVLDIGTHLDHTWEDSLRRNWYRARSRMRRSALYIGADRIFTLTTGVSDNLYHPSDFWRHWNRTCLAMKRRGHPLPPWLMAVEAHRSERTSAAKWESLHGHLLVPAFVDVGVLRDAWGLGNVDVSKRREDFSQGDGDFRPAERAAFYLASYVGGGSSSKGDAMRFVRREYPNARLWNRSQSAKCPEYRFTAETPERALELLSGTLGPLEVRHVERDGYRPALWACRTLRASS